MAARDFEEYPLTVGDKVEILLLYGTDAYLKIKVGDVAKIVLIKDGIVYCYNPCWDFGEGAISMRYMMYRQMRKLNKC